MIYPNLMIFTLLIFFNLAEKFLEAGVPCELKIKPGAEHGFWNDMMSYTGQFADWFDRFLIKNTE